MGESVVQGFELESHPDPIIERAHFSIEVGQLVRRWEEHCADLTFLRWLQYIAMYTDTLDMGYIPGDYQQPFDTSYVYRFFLHVPEWRSNTKTPGRST